MSMSLSQPLRQYLRYVLAGLFLGCACAARAWEVTDDTGVSMHLPHAAQRVIVTAPNLVEIVAALGGQEQIVGVSAYSDFPPAMKSKPRIGDAFGMSLEHIVALRPDLVLAWGYGSNPHQLEKLRSLGFAVYIVKLDQLDDMPKLYARIGALLGREQEAQQLAAQWQEQTAALKKRYKDKARVRVFFQLWTRPLMTVSKRSFIGQMLQMCGATNLFAEASGENPSVALESVMRGDPQIIFSDDPQPDTALQIWKPWQQISAVRNQRLIGLPADLVSRPGPRLLQGMSLLCESIDQAR